MHLIVFKHDFSLNKEQLKEVFLLPQMVSFELYGRDF